jgi:hypothetical protein
MRWPSCAKESNMKQTSPEDRDLEKISSEVSERYRPNAQDEPPARLDAAVLAAARREVEQQRRRRNWQMPASIAAMLVIGVSLVFIVRDNEPPLQSLEQPAANEAKLAKAAPPHLAMKPQSKMNSDLHRERPSRERSARPDREPTLRNEMAAAPESAAREKAAAGTGAPSVQAPAAAPVQAPTAAPVQAPAAPPKGDEHEQSQMAESRDYSPGKKKAEESAVAAARLPQSERDEMRKQAGTDAAKPADWLRRIEDLLRVGDEATAREQLKDFRKQFPLYPLPQRLQVLLPPDQH